MPALVIGHCFPGFGSDELRPFLDSTDDAFCCQFEVYDRHVLFVIAGCYNGCLVAYVLYVCSAKTRSQSCQAFRVVFDIYVAIQHQGL